MLFCFLLFAFAQYLEFIILYNEKLNCVVRISILYISSIGKMTSPTETSYSHILQTNLLQTNHSNETRKRKKKVLSKNTKIHLLMLITYLYIRLFVGIFCLVSLILFRCYHSIHPEIISSMMNKSFLIRSVWSNYYTNPGFLINKYTHRGIQSSFQNKIKLDLQTNLNAVNVGTKNTIYGLSTSSRKRYLNYSYPPLSNSQMQVVFTTNDIENKKLLRPVITSLNDTLLMMLVDFTTPLISSKVSISSKKTIETKSKVETTSSLLTKTKKPNMAIGNKNKLQKIKKGKTISGNRKNTNSKAATQRNSKLNYADLIYGYVNVDKGIAIIYENGIPHVYKVSKEFIYKYLLTKQHL